MITHTTRINPHLFCCGTLNALLLLALLLDERERTTEESPKICRSARHGSTLLCLVDANRSHERKASNKKKSTEIETFHLVSRLAQCHINNFVHSPVSTLEAHLALTSMHENAQTLYPNSHRIRDIVSSFFIPTYCCCTYFLTFFWHSSEG